MKDLAISDSTGDLVLENGDLTFVENADCVKQFVIQRLKLFAGEWFLDISQGVPWFSDILKKNPDIIVVDALLKEAILDTPGVVELMSFEFEFNSAQRTLTVSTEIRSQDGLIEIFNEEIAA